MEGVTDNPDWRLRGVRVVRADELDPNTPQTPGMTRMAAISAASAGAEKLWAGTVDIEPNAKTGAHHHVESVIYVVRGRARMRWGERPRRLHLRRAVRAASGDQRERRRVARVRRHAKWSGAGRREPRPSRRRAEP